MQVSCLSLHPALALIRQLRRTAQLEEIIGPALEKYKRPLMMLFSLPSVPFCHSSYVMHLFTHYGLFGCLIAFVAKKTFCVLPVPIWTLRTLYLYPPLFWGLINRRDIDYGPLYYHHSKPDFNISICIYKYRCIGIYTYIGVYQFDSVDLLCIYMFIKQIHCLICTSQMGGMFLLQCKGSSWN